LKIYLAGKISKNCWRHLLVKNLRNEFLGGCGESMTDFHWPIMPNAMGDGLHYCGPYFVSCDHGCFHSNGATHGAVASYENMSHDETCYADQAYRNAFGRCLDSIENADCVFCWIDSNDCFGTIAEIGYAKAMGKFICIAFSDVFDADEFWFVRSMADDSFATENPEIAFGIFKKRFCENKDGVRFLF